MRKSKIRFLYMFIVGIGISFLMKWFVYTNQPLNGKPWYHHFVAIIITIVVWEGNLQIDHWMNLNFPWVTKTRQRLLFHLPVALIYSALSLYSLLLLYNWFVCGVDTEHQRLMKISIVISLIISFMILSVEISAQLLKGWKNSLVDVEKYKTESALAQLQNLKDQINPHFLFNNLSVLSSLVYQDQDKAVDFINQLSKVYRYVLDHRNTELVRVEEEMKFIDSYIYLLKIRFGSNVEFERNIEVGDEVKLLPPMAMQMLLENAIKHNEISASSPLKIHIVSNSNFIEVKNNFQPRSNIELSSKTGIKNIQERYHFFTEKEIEIIQNENDFIVRLPLIN